MIGGSLCVKKGMLQGPIDSISNGEEKAWPIMQSAETSIQPVDDLAESGQQVAG